MSHPNPTPDPPVSEPAERRSRLFGETFRAMEYPLFRRFWLGAFLSFTGSWVQMVAHGWLVYDLTRSELWLGVTSFVGTMPMLILGLFGGAIADRFNRKKILYCTQSMFALSALTLATLTLTNHINIYVILVLSFINGIVGIVDMPTRLSMVSELVPKKDLANGIALNAASFQTARIFGPALGGMLLEWVGPGYCFLINGFSYLAILLALASIPLQPSASHKTSASFVEGLLEGALYVRSQPGLLALVCNISVLSLFGLSYLTLMPAIADKVLGVGKAGLGQLYTFAGIGSLCGLLIMARLSQTNHRGKLILFAANGFAWTLFAFSLVQNIWIAKGLLMVAGMFGVMQMASTNTALQTLAPDHLRGRVLSLHTWSINAPAPFAALLAGNLAQWYGPPISIRVGASVCALMALGLLLFVPAVRRVK